MQQQNLNLKIVINKYSKDFLINSKISKLHFNALEHFLKLASEAEIPCFPDETIDNAWHTFIIHTKLYSDYCSKKFKKFIHHHPIDQIKKPMLGYLCNYNFQTQKLEYFMTKVSQAVCDGGGGHCRSCSNN